MNRHLGDDSFSKLLHTSYADLCKEKPLQPVCNQTPPRLQEEALFCGCSFSFDVYDLSLSNLNPTERIVLDKRIDRESYIIFNTFSESLKKVFSPVMSSSIVPMVIGKGAYDFAPLINSLSRILELEINSSIVQDIRQMRGIEMPAYYKKYKPDHHDLKITIGTKEIDLNCENDGKLKPMMIGESLMMMRYYKKHLAKTLKVEENVINQHLKQLEVLRDYRNKASHSNVITEKEFVDFYNMFCNLMRQGLLTIWANDKERLCRYNM